MRSKVIRSQIVQGFWHIKKVVESCTTWQQYLKVDNWATEWFRRMEKAHPEYRDLIGDYNDLYFGIFKRENVFTSKAIQDKMTKTLPCPERYEDLTGRRYGNLTVVGFVELGDGNITKWLCRCDCGRETKVKKTDLVSGKVTHCGCKKKDEPKRHRPRAIDMTGQRIGRLTVIGREYSRGSHIFWRCRCDCGNECIVIGYNLRRGNTKSCGCLRRELLSIRQSEKGINTRLKRQTI